jgi:hypothetical protein
VQIMTFAGAAGGVPVRVAHASGRAAEVDILVSTVPAVRPGAVWYVQ